MKINISRYLYFKFIKMDMLGNISGIVCHLCHKNITKSRKVAVGYNITYNIDICHWKCFVGTFANTHDHTYIGIKKYCGGVPNIVQWSDLSDKDKKSAKTTLTKIKMYGDLEIHKAQINGIKISSDENFFNNIAKIYEDNRIATKKMFADRKKEWLQAENNSN